MKTKLLTGSIALLIGIIIYQKTIISDQDNQIFNLNEEKIVEFKRIRDSAQSAIAREATRSQRDFDSILNIPPKIKYIRYEEKIYINRTLNDALRVHSEYKSNGN